jgi:hypothetical protein
MKKKWMMLAIVILTAVIALGAGCGMDQEQTGLDGDLGALVLRVSKPLQMQTIAPDVEMEIDYYNIEGTGPSGETFFRYEVVPTGPTDTVTVQDLVIGEWNVKVFGINPQGYLIAKGEENVVVSPGGSSEIVVPISPLPGPGELSVSISWPEDMVAQPSVDATLSPVGGTPDDADFTINGGSASFVSSPPLEAGYYALTVQLKDADTVVWGATDAVRILAGWTSEGDFPLTDEDINQAGGDIGIIIDPDLENPLDITLDGVQDLLVRGGGNMTVSATTDPVDPLDGSYQYQWYLNGAEIAGATDASVTIDPDTIDLGNYRLDLLIAFEDTLSSANARFSVIEPVSTNVFNVTVQYPTTDFDGRPVIVTTYRKDGNIPVNDQIDVDDTAVLVGNTADVVLDRSGAGYEDGTYRIRAHIDTDGNGTLTALANTEFVTLKQRTIDGSSVSVTLNGPWGSYEPFLVFNTPPSGPDLTGKVMYIYLLEEGDTWGNYAFASNNVSASSGVIAIDSWGVTPGTLFKLMAVIDMNDNFTALGVPDTGDYVFTRSSIFLSDGAIPNQNIEEVEWVLQ